MSDLTAPARTAIIMGGSVVHSITSPREIAEAEQGKRQHAAALRVQIPVGDKGKSKIIEVPLSRRDLQNLIVAAGGALVFLDGGNVQ